MYNNTVNGASDTMEFLNFFAEASGSIQPNGNPVLMVGDIIVLDNCPTHHNAGGFALGQWLDTLGIDVVYLPTYSPEMTPVELVFQKLKIILKRGELEALVFNNLHAAIYHAIEEITPNDMQRFFRHNNCIFVWFACKLSWKMLQLFAIKHKPQKFSRVFRRLKAVL